MKSNATSIIVIIIFAFVLSELAPILNNIISKVRYGALSEKEISQEILIESKDYYENLSPKDYSQFGEYFFDYLQPIYVLIDSLNVIFSEPAPVSNVFIQIDNEINDKINIAISNTQNENFKRIPEYIDYNYEDISNAIKKIESNVISKKDKEINLLSIRNNLNKLQNNLSNIVLNFVYHIEHNKEKILINNFIVEKVTSISSDNLIDNKPYFSLPPELAQNKEDEIFSYLKLNSKDPIGLIALTQLYLEMRNISDAKLIYDVFLNNINRFSSNDIELLTALTQEQIRIYSNENIEADLTNTTLTLEENLNAVIEEDYDIVGSSDDKKILILLPYSSKYIIIHKITDQQDSSIDNYSIRDSWKNSSILELNNSADIQQIHLKYTTKDFVKYDEDFGKFQFKYGGLSTSSRLIVNAIIPSSFKVTALQSSPEESKIVEYSRCLKWTNPILPYKISALNFVGAKFGIAGELTNFKDLYHRQCFTLIIIVLFFFLDWLSKKTIKPAYVRNIFYFIIAITASFLILNDIKYIDFLKPYVNKINFNVFRWGVVVLAFGLVFFIEKKYDDISKPVRLSKATLEIIFMVLFLKLSVQNADFDDKMRFILMLGGFLWCFWIIIEKISTEININKVALVTNILIIGAVVFFATRNLELYKFPKFVLDVIGYIFGAVIITLIATCYIASTKKIVNKYKKPFIENIEEWIAIKVGSFAKDFTKTLILLLIILAFFFQSILIAVIPILIASFFQKPIDNWINKNLPKEIQQEKKKRTTKTK